MFFVTYFKLISDASIPVFFLRTIINEGCSSYRFDGSVMEEKSQFQFPDYNAIIYLTTPGCMKSHEHV